MTKATETKNVPAIAAEIEGDAITLTFSDGDTLVLTAGMVNADIQERAMMHGFKQKLVDAAAMSRNPDTGRAATIADKKTAVGEVYERLLRGEWNKVREGGAGAGGLLFTAICRLYPTKTPDELRAWLDGKTDEEKAAMRTNPKIAPVIAAIKAERAKTGDVDTDALLGELDD